MKYLKITSLLLLSQFMVTEGFASNGYVTCVHQDVYDIKRKKIKTHQYAFISNDVDVNGDLIEQCPPYSHAYTIDENLVLNTDDVVWSDVLEHTDLSCGPELSDICKVPTTDPVVKLQCDTERQYMCQNVGTGHDCRHGIID